MTEAAQGHTVRIPGIDLVRVAAIALIVNSHMDGFYPAPALATGGAIGNALFFALSGYGLATSARGARPGLVAWYRHRACRLYPALLPALVLFVALPGRAWERWGLREWVAQVVWPTEYWFVGALLLFYLLFYPLRRIDRAGVYLGVLAALFVPYLVWYMTSVDLSRYTIEGEGYFKWIHYFQVMLFGAFLARRGALGATVAGWRELSLLVAVLAGYHGLLLLVVHRGAGALQGLTHLLVYPMIHLALRLAVAPATRRFLALPGVGAAVALVAGLTLELYLVQGAVRSLRWVQAPVFPVDVLACWAATLAAAYLLHRIALVVARTARCSP